MLKQANRLPAGLRLNNPKTINSSSFLFKRASSSLLVSRFSFIISKKVAQSAVDRNRSKRIIRSCVEELLSEIKPGYDHLFIIKKNLNQTNRDDILNEVKNVFGL